MLDKEDLRCLSLIYWQSFHLMRTGKMIPAFKDEEERLHLEQSLNRLDSMEMIEAKELTIGEYKDQPFPMINSRGLEMLKKYELALSEGKDRFAAYKELAERKPKKKKHRK